MSAAITDAHLCPELGDLLVFEAQAVLEGVDPLPLPLPVLLGAHPVPNLSPLLLFEVFSARREGMNELNE